jgi:hypothetical protein
MESSRRSNTETLLFFLAFGLAIVLRLLRLGDLPLSDREAELALQAWQAAQGLRPVLGPQPGYVVLTAALFFVFGSSDILARLVPALAGGLLVLVPSILRERLPGRSAIYLALIFALEPGFLALSRTAGSAMLAVSLTLLAIALWFTHRPRWAGAFAGLALLSGPALLPGLLGLGLAILINGGKFWDEAVPPETDAPVEDSPASASTVGIGEPIDALESLTGTRREDALSAMLVGAGVFIFAGSMLFLLPRGLGAAFLALPVYLRGWVSFPDVPFSRLVIALVVYQAFGIAFALMGLVYGRSARSRLASGLGFWLLTALVLALVYPSRQVADLAWALIPLWALAAIGLDRMLDFSRENPWETAGLAALTITLLGFAYLNFANLALLVVPPQDAVVRWAFVGGTIVMLGVVIALVALGWSTDIAKRGAVWGIIIAFGLYTLSVSLGAAGLKAQPTRELWRDTPVTVDSDLLSMTLDELSVTSRGAVDSLPVTVYGVESPALMWVLRDWGVGESAAAPLDSASPLIVGPDQADISFGAAYRGQDFIWRLYPAWDSTNPYEWLRWIVNRDMPAGQEKIILWARTDLFPDSQNASP